MEKKVDRFKPIEVNTHSEFFDCQCMSNEHMVRFMYFEDSFEKENSLNETADLFLTVFLDPAPWYNRIWIGIKYIFGYKCKYGHFGEWIMHPRDITRLREMLEKFEKFYEDNPEKTPREDEVKK